MVDSALSRSLLEDWYLNLPPAWLTVCCPASGRQIREPSLAAAQVRWTELPQWEAETGREIRKPAMVVEKYLAAGQEAQSCVGQPGTAVFSPFRQGQIACYDGAQYLFRTLLRKIFPGLPLSRPVVLVRTQENASQVEKIALTDAAIQAGARRVLLYQESLPALLAALRERRDLRRIVALDIEP